MCNTKGLDCGAAELYSGILEMGLDMGRNTIKMMMVHVYKGRIEIEAVRGRQETIKWDKKGGQAPEREHWQVKD